MEIKFSIIVPVFNRPQEINELLLSLTKQTYKSFEVVVVEDGSIETCRHIVENYESGLTIKYFYKENSGQGFSRNFGFEKAEGNYLIVFDSDCIIPQDYLQIVKNAIVNNGLDAYGGPDKAHPSFNNLQKAISYSMTSFFTTGGIRGKKKHAGPFHPRSFNMGISKEVYKRTGGYIITRMGEDIEFSIRISRLGFKTELVENAYVYHKRRTNLIQFFKQVHFFGRARINIFRFFPEELKLVHTVPAFFTIGLVSCLFMILFQSPLSIFVTAILLLYFLLIFFEASFQNKNIIIGFLAILTSIIQLTGYGIGFITELGRYLFSKKRKDYLQQR